MKDVKLILNSHAHFDHDGGIAALQQASGAVVVASADGKREMMAGQERLQGLRAGCDEGV
jgi:metallo-beta-lactamase class B